MQRRLDLFCSLPLDRLDRLKLTQLTRDIGKQERVDGDSAGNP
jgi:hypothetical protein